MNSSRKENLPKKLFDYDAAKRKEHSRRRRIKKKHGRRQQVVKTQQVEDNKEEEQSSIQTNESVLVNFGDDQWQVWKVVKIENQESSEQSENKVDTRANFFSFEKANEYKDEKREAEINQSETIKNHDAIKL